MKKKILALALTLAMVLSLLPATALATEGVTEETQADTQVEQEDEGTPSTNPDDPDASETVIVPEAGKAAIGKKTYNSVKDAVEAAKSGDTIILGEGNYTLYKVPSEGKTKGKDLTFIGQGAEKTGWNIGAPVPDPANFGTEYNGDYSFDGAGTVTFQNMTLRSGTADYLGFIRADKTIVKDCTINGKTFYWGYTSAEFINTTFNCPLGDYALWTYSSPVMTFDGCTFNSSGKVINVYTDYGAGKYDITVNFKDCTIDNKIHIKQVLNINDSNMGNFKYRLNISGDIKVSGVDCDEVTCSRLFGFGGKTKDKDNNTGKTIVKFGRTTVWEKGAMVDASAFHNSGVKADGVSYDNGVTSPSDSLYAEGYKDNAVTTKTTTQGKRTVTTKTCNYCGWSEESSVSRSKTATNLDSNYESKVTLSLPSAEENLATDVVLVLDASKCTKDMLKATIELIENLEKQVELGANIKVGIVMFKGNAVPFRTLEKAGDLKTLRETFTGLIQANDTDGEATKAAVRAYVAETCPDFMNGGTNVPSGLQLAKNMLEEDTSVTDARKYVVLVSDGDTYLFCHKNGENSGYDYTKAYTRAGPSKEHIGGVSEYDTYDTNVPVRNKYLAAKNTLNKDSWNDYLKYVGEHNENFAKYDFQASAEAFNNNKFPDGFTDDLLIPENVTDRIINSDVSRYQTAELYSELQEKYNCYYCFLPGGYDQARTMLKVFTPTDHLIDAAGTNQDNIFSSITKDIVYLLGTGSTVKDEIGSGKDNKGNDYNFDFVDKAEAMTLTVGETTYVTQKAEAAALTKHETSRYLFKAEGVVAANQAEAPYVLHYYQKGEDGKSNDECFVWDINVNVSNFETVQLTYTVKLTNPQSQKGTTYGVYDRSGEKQTANSSLYTNLSATLKPVNSNGVKGADETFLKPTVSYTIKGSSGGHGGGTVTIPDNVPSGLNGKDHYAYVVGYPDGMVYPQKNITRAEVATIFFRLLEDETREANMTKSNGYNDMKDGAWYTCAVSTLSKMGIIKGYEDGSFKPDASISRAEFAAIAARFDPDGDKTPATFSDVSSHWAKDEISIAANHGWIKGYEDGSFKPDQKITRAETMTLVNRVLKRLPETKDDLHKDMKTWPDNQNESAWFYLAVQEATNSHYQKLKKDGTHETWESMRETRDWAALEK